MDSIIFGMVYGTFVYSLYVQFSPSMGGIWFRNGHFVPKNLFRLMIYPFFSLDFWYPTMWIVNWPIVVSVFGGLFYYLGHQLDHGIPT